MLRDIKQFVIVVIKLKTERDFVPKTIKKSFILKKTVTANSDMYRLPVLSKEFRDFLGWGDGDVCEMSLRKNTLIIKKVK